MKQIPFNPYLSTDQELKFTIEDGTLLTLHLYWNERSATGNWFMDISLVDLNGNTQTYYGIKLVPGFPLLSSKWILNLPGDFLFLPVSSDARGTTMLWSDFGSVWFLYWCTSSEMNDWRNVRGI